MAKKSNRKPLLIGVITSIVVIAAVIIGIIIANSNRDESSSENTSESSSARVTANELKGPIDVSVTYGDFNEMQAVSKKIQNGEMTGKIVKIDGLVNNPGMSYAIVEPSSDGATKIGTVFQIEDSSEYPADGARITITAKVVEVEPMVFYLITLKDFAVKYSM